MRDLSILKDSLFWLKSASVVSFVLAAFWLSQISQPLVHCHSSTHILAVVDSTGEDNATNWFTCEWWDYLLPRQRLSQHEMGLIQNWRSQIRAVEKLDRVLPALSKPILTIKDRSNPFAYQITGQHVILGDEILKSEDLFFRALVQAWITQVDSTGLDAFEIEVLTDFLFVISTRKTQYKNPITGLAVQLKSTHHWPEKARNFFEYCVSNDVSLQHLNLCTSESVQGHSPQTKKFQTASLWSGRLTVLSRLIEEWEAMDQAFAWQSLSGLRQRLIKSKKWVEEGSQEATITAALNRELSILRKVIGVSGPKDEGVLSAVNQLIDWNAGELEGDFLDSDVIQRAKLFGGNRVWLRYKNQFWDLGRKKKINYETAGLSFEHVIRVQCHSNTKIDGLAMGAKSLTLIHHCQAPGKNWELLFEGQIQKFLSKNKELAFLELRPGELSRFLKWNPELKKGEWNPETWRKWLGEFGVNSNESEGKEQSSVSGVWDVIKEFRLPYSANGS